MASRWRRLRPLAIRKQCVAGHPGFRWPNSKRAGRSGMAASLYGGVLRGRMSSDVLAPRPPGVRGGGPASPQLTFESTEMRIGISKDSVRIVTAVQDAVNRNP